jgi:hypothetical protein
MHEPNFLGPGLLRRTKSEGDTWMYRPCHSFDRRPSAQLDICEKKSADARTCTLQARNKQANDWLQAQCEMHNMAPGVSDEPGLLMAEPVIMPNRHNHAHSLTPGCPCSDLKKDGDLDTKSTSALEHACNADAHLKEYPIDQVMWRSRALYNRVIGSHLNIAMINAYSHGQNLIYLQERLRISGSCTEYSADLPSWREAPACSNPRLDSPGTSSAQKRTREHQSCNGGGIKLFQPSRNQAPATDLAPTLQNEMNYLQGTGRYPCESVDATQTMEVYNWQTHQRAQDMRRIHTRNRKC